MTIPVLWAFKRALLKSIITEPQEVSNIYITDVVIDAFSGQCTYKLHVENFPFVGYANTIATKSDNIKRADINFSPYGNTLTFTQGDPAGITLQQSKPVTIPVGVYVCTIQMSITPTNVNSNAAIDAAINYSLTDDYYNYLAQVESHFELLATNQL